MKKLLIALSFLSLGSNAFSCLSAEPLTWACVVFGEEKTYLGDKGDTYASSKEASSLCVEEGNEGCTFPQCWARRKDSELVIPSYLLN